MEEKTELLPRSFVILRELWREVKKKTEGVAPPSAKNSAHAPVLYKKRGERR